MVLYSKPQIALMLVQIEYLIQPVCTEGSKKYHIYDILID